MKSRLSFLLPLLLAAVVRAEPVNLQAIHKEGDISVEKYSYEMSLKGTVSMQGAETEMAMVNNVTRERRDEVLAVKDGKRVKVKRTFVTDTQERTQTVGGQTSPAQSRNGDLMGKVFVLEADGAGVKSEGAGAEAMNDRDRRLTSDYELLLPGKAVEIGEKWTLTDAQVQNFFSDRKLEKGSISCALEAVEDHNGRKAARILVELVSSGMPKGQPVNVNVTMKGPLWWDIEKGRLIDATFEGNSIITIPGGGTLEGPMKAKLSQEEAK